MRRMWHLANVLGKASVPVRFLRSHDPGRLLYFDDFQVVTYRTLAPRGRDG